VDGAFGQSCRAVAAGDFAAQHGADGAVHVADGEAAGDGGLRFESRRGLGDERVIERGVEAVILGLHLTAGHTRRHSGRVEDGGKVDALGLPVRVGQDGVDFFNAADHLVDGAEAELGHVFADLLGEEEEEVDDVLGLAGEAGAEDGVLRGDAD